MIEQFLQHLREQGKSEQTITNYLTSWRRFETWYAAHVVAEDQTEGARRGAGGARGPGQALQLDIANFKKYAGKNFKASTVDLTMKHLKVIFRYFAESGVIPDNPVANVKHTARARTSPKWLERNEQNALLRAVRASGDVREYAIVVLFLRTGVRVGELVNIERSHVKISERSGSLYVPAGIEDRDRDIPLNAEVRSAITAYLEKHTPRGKYLFDSQRSEQCTTRAVQHILAGYAKITGLDLSPHTLRHTFGHDLVTAGNPLDLVASLMGHFKNDGTPNIAMTIVYTTPSKEDKQRAVESISWE